MEKIFLIIIALISGSISSPAQAGTVTITNQYPSPVGIYNRLRLMPSALLTGPCDIGSFYVPAALNIIYYCKDGTDYIPLSSPWAQTGTYVHLVDPDNNVGIGTQTPEFKLSLGEGANADGGILAKGVFGAGANLTTPGAGTRFIWYPKKAALRVGGVDGDQWNDANIGNYSIGLGFNNKIISTYSNIAGGRNNQIFVPLIYNGNPLDGHANIGGGAENIIYEGGRQATISGGTNNIIGASGNMFSGMSATIGGGSDNKARGIGSTIAGGINNEAGDITILWDLAAFVGAGRTNKARAVDSVIGGGSFNTIEVTSQQSFIGGGSNNLIGTYRSTIAGGTNNRIEANATDSFIGGGNNNRAWGSLSTIGGGQNNVTGISGDPSKIQNTVGGGFDNQAAGIASFIGGGAGNRSTAQASTVAGGNSNQATGTNSTVAGGSTNIASGNNSMSQGGTNNTAAGDYSSASGQNMVLDPAADRTFIWGHSASAIPPVATSDAFIIYSGNVGIGTTKPDQKLQVAGAVKLEPPTNTPPCNASNHLGTLYVSSNGGLCFCNFAQTWENISSKGICP